MGVVLTDNITDHAGRFLVGLVVVVAHVVHGVQTTPVHRLEAVAHIRQGPADDDRHGVVHVGAFHLVFDIDRYLVLAECLSLLPRISVREIVYVKYPG